MRVNIIGGGPAASAFALSFLNNVKKKTELKIFRGNKEFFKPCGEALLGLNLESYYIQPEVVNEIKNFYIYVEDELVAERHYSSAKWFIIDKKRWIEEHMREISKYGGIIVESSVSLYKNDFEGLIVDARGPFSKNNLKKIPIASAIVETKEESLQDSVRFYFDPKNIGFYWIFPRGKTHANIGYGSLYAKNPQHSLLSFIASRLKSSKVVSLRTSLITVEFNGTSEMIWGSNLRIGEASGTVFPLTGEGIRPSYIHGKLVGEISTENVYPREIVKTLKQKTEFKKIYKQLRLQSQLLKLYSRIPLKYRVSVIKKLKNDIDSYLLKDEVRPLNILLNVS